MDAVVLGPDGEPLPRSGPTLRSAGCRSTTTWASSATSGTPSSWASTSGSSRRACSSPAPGCWLEELGRQGRRVAAHGPELRLPALRRAHASPKDAGGARSQRLEVAAQTGAEMVRPETIARLRRSLRSPYGFRTGDLSSLLRHGRDDAVCDDGQRGGRGIRTRPHAGRRVRGRPGKEDEIACVWCLPAPGIELRIVDPSEREPSRRRHGRRDLDPVAGLDDRATTQDPEATAEAFAGDWYRSPATWASSTTASSTSRDASRTS